MIVSDSNYQVITIQGDTVISPWLAYSHSYLLTSFNRTTLWLVKLPVFRVSSQLFLEVPLYVRIFKNFNLFYYRFLQMFWESSLVIEVSSYLFPNPVLRTHIWKNYIILFIIYDVLICFVVFTGLRTGQYDWFMRWWKSRLGQGLLQS